MTVVGAQCQSNPTPKQNSPVARNARQAFDHHAKYKEVSITHRRFKHKDIVPLLEKLKQNPLFQVQVVGKSVEDRDLYLVKAGTGKTKIMLWSQMHGDESTATMALFDIFNFLQASDDLNPLRQEILKNNTLYFIPMLNPDGAERFTRRNALDIDLNRDALRLQSPEAVLLKSLRDSLKPDFGFNLHDQSRLYTVGTTPQTATISFLAPAYDYAQSVNQVRERAMRTIAGLNEGIQQFLPGQVAKYSDDHEPRAFGDNIQKWGTSLILIESGGYRGDPEKQYIRQVNFAAILAAMQMIGDQGYKKYEVKDYFKIPQNERYLYDFVLRNVRYQQDGRSTLLDLGINRNEASANTPQGFYHRSSIDEIGDMRVFHGYEELNAEGLTLVPGKVSETTLDNIADLTAAKAKDLLAAGYTTVRVRNLPLNANPVDLPLNVLSVAGRVNHALGLARAANFLLKDKAGKVRYAVVNGFLYDLSKPKPELFHGLVL
ncbi:peptidase M14 [Rufibacter immobilis]|uniref:Peptidase M14 n=1 Tax=Rufibacter immobilis TaxID=1348778 RepID=A0A3M9MR45_9BACT|nr:M14 metallopeptidase family protein [Rufibacter immobilis]RNI28012.1 peptidase M14 [Rufibacter immobilis]